MRAGLLGGALRRSTKHHAATFATAADLHLDLDDRSSAELAGGLGRLLGGRGDDPARRGDPVGAEQVLALCS